MSDQNQHDYLRTDNRNFRLTADVTALMLKGAGYAALFCLILGIAYAVLIGISSVLPEDSKFGLDPTPTSLLIEDADGVRTLI